MTQPSPQYLERAAYEYRRVKCDPLDPPPQAICPACDGKGRFPTANEDGRLGCLPRSMKCETCEGEGRI